VSKDFKPKVKKPKFKEDLEITVTILIMISVFYGLTYFGVDKILSTAIVASFTFITCIYTLNAIRSTLKNDILYTNYLMRFTFTIY